MYNYTRRFASLSVCVPEEGEEVVLNTEFDDSYIVSSECDIIPAFSSIHTYKSPLTVPTNVRYYLTADICCKYFKDKVAIRKELQNALSGNFLLSYCNISEHINRTAYRSSIPDFIHRLDVRITRNGFTYFRYKSDIFAKNNENNVVVPVLMFGNLRKALPSLLGDRFNKLSTVSNKQTILLFNDKFLKENPDKYMRSRLRQYITKLKRDNGYSLKFVTTDFFNNMFVEIPKAGLFNSIKAIEARKELLLDKVTPKTRITTDSLVIFGTGENAATNADIEEIELPF